MLLVGSGHYVDELNLSTCTVYKRASISPGTVPRATADATLCAMRRDPTEEPFEFFARLQSAWEAAVKDDNTSWSGGDMRKHFCQYAGQ